MMTAQKTLELPQSGYTMHQAAIIIGCTPKAIYPKVHQGQITPYLGIDGVFMISREEVYAYLRKADEKK
jgi:hypothetical protein